MRILVCGGRGYDNYPLVSKTLSELTYEEDNMLPKIGTVIIHGGAPGADSLADKWAISNWVPFEEYKADWKDLSYSDAVIKTGRDGRKYDAKAGHRRNKRMIDEGRPDLVVAFPGGKGTADMVRQARAAGIKVMEIEDDPTIS